MAAWADLSLCREQLPHCWFHNCANKNIKVSSFKSSENIQKKQGGPDCTVLNNTVRPNSVAGKAGHVRLERPIDSSSGQTVCAPKVAEKGPYKGATLGFINKPLTDPDFCSCRQYVLLFSRGIWEIHAEFLAFFVQNLQIISHNSCH